MTNLSGALLRLFVNANNSIHKFSVVHLYRVYNSLIEGYPSEVNIIIYVFIALVSSNVLYRETRCAIRDTGLITILNLAVHD